MVGQLVVALAKPAEERALMKTVAVASLDPWAQFCAAADEGGEVACAAAGEGMVATVTR